jgi:AcrR family transcriptional regulator
MTLRARTSRNSKSAARHKQGVSAPSPDRRERRQTETRERLFRAALKLFGERGFFETTVEDITEAADVGKGTFFNYFPTKEHVLSAFGELQVGKIEAAIHEARTTEFPFPDLFRRLVHALMYEPARSAAFLRSVIIANLSSEFVRRHLCAKMGHGRQMLAEFLTIGQERGDVRRDVDALELARSVQEGFFGAMLLWCMNDGSQLQTWYQPLFRLLWSGLDSRAEHGDSPWKE